MVPGMRPRARKGEEEENFFLLHLPLSLLTSPRDGNCFRREATVRRTSLPISYFFPLFSSLFPLPLLSLAFSLSFSLSGNSFLLPRCLPLSPSLSRRKFFRLEEFFPLSRNLSPSSAFLSFSFSFFSSSPLPSSRDVSFLSLLFSSFSSLSLFLRECLSLSTEIISVARGVLLSLPLLPSFSLFISLFFSLSRCLSLSTRVSSPWKWLPSRGELLPPDRSSLSLPSSLSREFSLSVYRGLGCKAVSFYISFSSFK